MFFKKKALFYQSAAQEGMFVSSDPRPEAGSFFRSDSLAFVRAGIPTIYIWNGKDFVNTPLNKVNHHSQKYHQPSDEYDER